MVSSHLNYGLGGCYTTNSNRQYSEDRFDDAEDDFVRDGRAGEMDFESGEGFRSWKQ